MKKRILLLCLLMVWVILAGHAADSPYYRVLIPAGKTRNGLSVLKPLPVVDPRYKQAVYLFDCTFMKISVRLYRDLQTYLANSGDSLPLEPAYLLLSGRQGGFPMKGFYLEENGTIKDKSNTWYVDLMRLDKNPASLNSITQIFPHEMGHIFFALLAPDAQKDNQSFSVDMHYFSVPTNVLTAFNEGFAEHFENASRLFEPNATIRDGVEQETRRLSSRLPHRITGLERDFRWPLRLAYYRAGLLLWYQSFEDFKRYRWALDSCTWLLNKNLRSANPEKNILYRNTGLGYGPARIRNAAQLASNEGAINGFFTRLLRSGTEGNPDSLRAYYLKLFRVMHEQMNHVPGDTSFLQLFILAWERQFPDEKLNIQSIYQASAGRAFDPDPLPEIWVKNEGFRHSFLVMDQFGGAIVPYYALNLNTAEETDLLSFRDISRNDAEAIVRSRDQRGGFHSIAEVAKVPGLTAEAAQALVHGHELTLKRNGEEEESGLSITRIILLNASHILLTGLWYFVGFMVVFFFLFLRKGYTIPQILLITLQKFLKLYLLILAGLACFMYSPTPVWPFLAVIVVVLAIDWLKTRKRAIKRKEVLFTTLLIAALIIYSLV